MKKIYFMAFLVFFTPGIAFSQIDASIYDTHSNQSPNMYDTLGIVSRIINIKQQQAELEHQQMDNQMLEAQIRAQQYIAETSDPNTFKLNMNMAIAKASRDPVAVPALPWLLEQRQIYERNPENN